MLKYIFIFIVLFSQVYGNESSSINFSDVHSSETKSILTDIGSEPSAIIAGCVNVISGNFIDYEVDLTLPGPEPFTFSRSYCSNDTSNSLFCRHWQTNQQGYILLKAQTLKHETELLVDVLGHLGTRTYFYSSVPQKTTIFDLKPHSEMYKKGTTNISQGVISAQNNLKNNRCKFKCSNTAKCTLTDGSGETHHYQGLKEAKNPSFQFSNKELFTREYILKSVIKPSGMSFDLSYLGLSSLETVTLKNRWNHPIAKLKISNDMTKKHGVKYYTYLVEAPDGRFAKYDIKTFGKKNVPVLKTVTRSDGPSISYEHEDAEYTHSELGEMKGHVERINRKNKPDGRFLAIEYYDTGDNEVAGKTIKIDSRSSNTYNRVRKILAPCGTDEMPKTLYSFDYCVSPLVKQWGTGVYDALGNKTDYFFSHQNRLESILKFNGKTDPYTYEQIYWWDDPNEICIKTRAFGLFNSVSKTYARSYFYDERGNLTMDVLYGNIRGKNHTPLVVDARGNIIQTGPDQKIKECVYSQDDMNLLTYMKDGETSRAFTYVPGTNLQASCLYWNSQGIYARTFHEYDENSMVVKSISDDGIFFDAYDLAGVTLRTIEYTRRSSTYPVGLPLEVRKMYWDKETCSECLIRREVNQFDAQGRMIEKKVYNALDEFAYTQEWVYNAWGNLLIEKNPLGHTISREYDANGNMIKEEGPGLSAYKTFTYDYSNRLIRKDEHHADGILSQHFSYDLMGNQIASIDVFGHQTDYIYDSFGRLLQEFAPSNKGFSRPVIQYAYDELSNPISITDESGSTIKSAYTIFGKPYRIEYPDGSLEQFEYDLENRLVKEISKNGSITLNTYDYQGRLTKKEVTDSSGVSLSVHEWGYNSCHLLYEKDALGNLTEYGYDAQGRKISIRKENSITTFEYDLMGRVDRTTYEGSVKAVKYDALDQIIEEREEDLLGNLLKQVQYQYDELGRKIATISGTGATSYCTYDSHGLPVETIDQEGHVTRVIGNYHYTNKIGQRVYQLESIDPMGIKTTTTHNIYGKVISEVIHNAYGVILHERQFEYDLKGNRIQVKEIPYLEDRKLEPRLFCFEYDVLNRPIGFIQAAGSCQERRIEHQYNLFGQKEKTIKPDGVTLHYAYDAIGRLKEHFSSDGSIHYQYSYDLNHNPIFIVDLVHNTTTERSYDACNNVTHEKMQNGLEIDLAFSPDGKIQKMILPDGTGIQYQYQGSFLKAVERIGQDGSIKYCHQYESYDLDGRILKESLLHKVGSKNYVYSPKGHLLKGESSFFTEACKEYDYRGNFLNRSIIDSEGLLEENFAYDDLGQLKKEKGFFSHTYLHDSLNNRLSQDDQENGVNTLNQLLEDKDCTYTYDLSGNLIEKTYLDGKTQYAYDALDRLIRIKIQSASFCYTYDELGRCMTSTQEGEDPICFLYLAQAEMGACSTKGDLIELQLLGLGRKTEPCSAVVIELNQNPYAVLHDQSGHVRALVDQNGSLAMTYRYSAFGMMESYSKNLPLDNPWTISGKRYHSLTGLVNFGHRFYDPKMGRWISQDPAGLDAGANLYAYLGNSPLVHYDAYGLFENDHPYSNYNAGPAYAGSEWLSPFFGISRPLIKWFGHALMESSHHLIPLPVIKDGPRAAGHFLKYGTLEGYTMSYQEPHSKIFTFGETGEGFGGHCSVNGLGNLRADQKTFGETVCKHYNGERTHHVGTASHGMLQDLCETGLQMLGVRTNQVKKAEKALQLAANDATSSGGAGYVTVDAHSRGGATFKGALPHLSSETKSKLYVSTYGGASMAKDKGVSRARNYVSSREYITPLAAPICYINARLFGDATIEFVPSEGGHWLDHGFQDATYQSALKESSGKYYKFIKE